MTKVPQYIERDTGQRKAIRKIFEEAEHPLSPQEVVEAGKKAGVRLSIATAYRNLRSLVEAGFLAVVEMPGEGDRFELAGKKHHHHFRCNQCNRVFDVHGCTSGLSRLVPDGFRLDSHEILFFGLCRDCNPAADPA